MANDDVNISGLDDLFKKLDKLTLTKEQKVKAVDKAADTYVEHLIPKIPVDEAKTKGKHLKDLITYKSGQYADGSTDVGFTKDGYYYRFLNNGTKDMKKHPNGLHFMEHAFDEAKSEMQQDIKNSLGSDEK